MKTAIIAIGTGASSITESAIFEKFGFDLCYFLINREMLINGEEISIDHIIEDIRKNAQKIILFSTLGGICNRYIPRVMAALVKNNLKYDAIVTVPFLFEGEQKMRVALNSLNNITESYHSISIFNNEKLQHCKPELSVRETYRWMDEQIVKLIEQIVENKLVESPQDDKAFPFIAIHLHNKPCMPFPHISCPE